MVVNKSEALRWVARQYGSRMTQQET